MSTPPSTPPSTPRTLPTNDKQTSPQGPPSTTFDSYTTPKKGQIGTIETIVDPKFAPNSVASHRTKMDIVSRDL